MRNLFIAIVAMVVISVVSTANAASQFKAEVSKDGRAATITFVNLRVDLDDCVEVLNDENYHHLAYGNFELYLAEDETKVFSESELKFVAEAMAAYADSKKLTVQTHHGILIGKLFDLLGYRNYNVNASVDMKPYNW